MAQPTQPTQAGKATGIAAIAGGAALGTVLVAVALVLWVLRDSPADEGATAPTPQETGTPPDAADTGTPPDAADTGTPQDAADTGTPPDAADTGPDLAAQAPSADPAAAIPPDEPRFDLVRIDPTGSAVIAGRAGARADVTLTIDGTPVDVVAADEAGQFVAMLALAPSDAPRILSLQAMLPGGAPVQGRETVLIAPFDGETDVILSTEAVLPPDAPGIGETTSSSPDLSGRAEDGAPLADALADLAPVSDDMAPQAETTPPAGAAPAVGASVAQAPAVLLADGDGIRVLQAPGAPPEALTEVQLDAISYDLEGAVTLAGRGPAEAAVQVMLNNQPINLGEIGPGGQWSLDLPDVDPGTYTLRLDQIAADGTITRGPETPFLREDPARIRDNPMLVADGASVITVQRGFTLWGIAEANFGDGILYVQIFAENRAEIRDPDLIFPGQIFALPDLPRAEGDQ